MQIVWLEKAGVEWTGMWIQAINFQIFGEKIGRQSLVFVDFQEGNPKQCALIYFMASLASGTISLCKWNNSSGFPEKSLD